MNSLETRRLEMLTRVRDFGATHAAEFPPASFGGEQFAAVGQVVEELTRLATAQSSSAGSARLGSANRAAAREELREDLQAIARTARAMSLDVPGLEDKFRLPRSGSDQALLTTARVFAADAVPLKAEFVRHEMPANFIEDLNASISQMEEAIRDQNASKRARKAAVAAIDEAMDRGIEAVRRLDPVVRNKFGARPNVLAEWESARHTQRAPRSQTGAGNNPDAAGGGTPNTQPPTP